MKRMTKRDVMTALRMRAKGHKLEDIASVFGVTYQTIRWHLAQSRISGTWQCFMVAQQNEGIK